MPNNITNKFGKNQLTCSWDIAQIKNCQANAKAYVDSISTKKQYEPLPCGGGHKYRFLDMRKYVHEKHAKFIRICLLLQEISYRQENVKSRLMLISSWPPKSNQFFIQS